MRSNKINNVDLFTQAANDKFSKHIKTKSKEALEIIKSRINWEKLLKPIEEEILKIKANSLVINKSSPDFYNCPSINAIHKCHP